MSQKGGATVEKGAVFGGEGEHLSALNWGTLSLECPVERRGQEWVWQKRLCFLIRRKGSRTKCEGPHLTQPVGIPVSGSCPAVPLAQPCRSVGSAGGLGRA